MPSRKKPNRDPTPPHPKRPCQSPATPQQQKTANHSQCTSIDTDVTHFLNRFVECSVDKSCLLQLDAAAFRCVCSPGEVRLRRVKSLLIKLACAFTILCCLTAIGCLLVHLYVLLHWPSAHHASSTITLFAASVKWSVLYAAYGVTWLGNALNSTRITEAVEDVVNVRGKCLLKMDNSLFQDVLPDGLFEEPTPDRCEFCKRLAESEHSHPHFNNQPIRLSGVNPKEFAERYAYANWPVIVTDATQNWTATRVFSLEFFRDLYLRKLGGDLMNGEEGGGAARRKNASVGGDQLKYLQSISKLYGMGELSSTKKSVSKSIKKSEEENENEEEEEDEEPEEKNKVEIDDKIDQFFPYKSGFETFSEFLKSVNSSRGLSSQSKPWYVGWLNKDPDIDNILSNHYSVPYFLPKSSEMLSAGWIFMGLPGYGAHMHIDSVNYASWQAQLRGKKLWTLKPPPECYLKCSRKQMHFFVNPGEIFVFNSNLWFHKTKIVGNDTSITIGAEYD